jgi:hypothetical protein
MTFDPLRLHFTKPEDRRRVEGDSEGKGRVAAATGAS